HSTFSLHDALPISCLSVSEAYPIVKDVCEALGEAHKKGVIHRDIKPENIVLVDKDDRKNYVKVVDFGVAKFVQAADEKSTKLTRTGSLCGSPAYMSPEQCSNEPIDQRS